MEKVFGPSAAADQSKKFQAAMQAATSTASDAMNGFPRDVSGKSKAMQMDCICGAGDAKQTNARV